MYRSKIAVLLLIVVALGACSSGTHTRRQGGDNAAAEQQAIATGFAHLTDSQQIPSFDYSQERQTVIDSETIRATGANGTTMFFIDGVGMIQWCPSSGAPVPSTYQLSADQQYVDLPGDNSRTLVPVQQGEPTGTYIGPSSGTWVVCLDDAGNKFGVYWEGPVGSTVGVVSTLDPALRVHVDELTFQFTEASTTTTTTGG